MDYMKIPQKFMLIIWFDNDVVTTLSSEDYYILANFAYDYFEVSKYVREIEMEIAIPLEQRSLWRVKKVSEIPQIDVDKL